MLDGLPLGIDILSVCGVTSTYVETKMEDSSITAHSAVAPLSISLNTLILATNVVVTCLFNFLSSGYHLNLNLPPYSPDGLSNLVDAY